MGTNYFVYVKGHDYCEHCKRGIIEMHVGKQSYGWKFLSQTYKDDNIEIKSMKAWIDFIKEKNLVIEDEYQKTITVQDFIIMVNGSQKGLSSMKYNGPGISGSFVSWQTTWDCIKERFFMDSECYEFNNEWFS